MLAGRKICGNAGYGMNGHYLYHGSVLIRTDLDLIDRLLTVTPDKLLKHGIRSVRQRVTNIADHCTVDDPGEFVKQLQQVIAPAKAETWSPDETVLKGLDRIKADFFGNGGWIADPQTAGTGTYPPGN